MQSSQKNEFKGQVIKIYIPKIEFYCVKAFDEQKYLIDCLIMMMIILVFFSIFFFKNKNSPCVVSKAN